MSDSSASGAATVAPPPATQRERPRKTVLQVLRLSALRRLALLPVIVLALIIGSQLNDAFLTTDNILTNVLGASAVLAVVVVAESLIIIGGHFDLSLQSLVGFAPMLSAWLVVPKDAGGAGLHLSPFLGLVVLFAVGAAIGLINGFLVARLKLNAFIVTLAMLILLQGLTLGVSGGQTLTSLPDAYAYLGNAMWLGVPAEVWVAALVFLAAGLFMRYHVVGREIYAMGGNEEAARAAGIKTTRVTWGLFVVGGMLAALAGLMLTSRIASVTANQGQDLIFTVFAAAVIGGIDLDGGRGSMAGAATGVVLLGVIQNILVVAEVPSFWVSAIYGGIILVSLMLGALAGSPTLGKLAARLRTARPATAPARTEAGA
ncbi:MAG: Monosaccharide transporter rane protein family [Conexibacter sp.]|nr:Monosaccharide transporter rane protein family [Conexibacter sp.]